MYLVNRIVFSLSKQNTMITETQKSYFRNPAHKAVSGFYFTSNGSAFYRECDADQQAANLRKLGKSDTVTHISRADYEAQLVLEAEAGSTDPEILHAQSDMDNALAAVKDADARAATDGADEDAARKQLDAAQAAGDAVAIGRAQAALETILDRVGKDAVTRKTAVDAAETARATVAARKSARNTAKKPTA
jgi:hypothetical protein